MSVRTGYGLVGMALVGLLASGCTVNGPDAQPTPATTSEDAGPQRPRDLAFAGKQGADLCTLLTPEQQTQLNVSRPKPAAPDEYSSYPSCMWFGPPGEETGMDVSVYAVPMALKDFKDQKLGEGTPETTSSYVVAGGFPAEQAQSAGREAYGCSVAVDVAEGQTLWAGAATLVPGTVSNQQMCGQAKQVAEFAVATLQSQG